MKKPILVIGGAGYVGCVLAQKLLANSYAVRVLDLFMYGRDVLAPWRGKNLEEIVGDLRDRSALKKALDGVDAVINLACVSNDPSFELNPELSKSINYDGLGIIADEVKKAGIGRFIHASTSSVYGVREEAEVTEDIPFEEFVPVSDYNKYKALGEELLKKELVPHVPTIMIRPATVCGYSPRLRLDLSVNILTHLAYIKRRITVFGGSQQRPNIHIDDITDLYVQLLEEPQDRIAGKIYNAGWENLTIREIAERVRNIVGQDVVIEVQPSNDPRSYRISSEKIKRELGFAPKKTIDDAVRELVQAFKDGKIPDPDNMKYYNVKVMKSLNLA